MEEEIESLKKNETWDIVMLLYGRKLGGSKWVFQKILNAAGQVEKYKDRLVAKRYSQVKAANLGETLFPDAKLTSINVLMHLVAPFDIEIGHIYEKT